MARDLGEAWQQMAELRGSSESETLDIVRRSFAFGRVFVRSSDRTVRAFVRYSRMDKGKDKSIPKSLPRRTWDATLHEQILHQREHARRIVANPGADAGLSPAKTPDRSRRPRSE